MNDQLYAPATLALEIISVLQCRYGPVSKQRILSLQKVKLKLSLRFSTKHHAMKAYWGSVCVAPLIL